MNAQTPALEQTRRSNAGLFGALLVMMMISTITVMMIIALPILTSSVIAVYYYGFCCDYEYFDSFQLTNESAQGRCMTCQMDS